MSWTVRRAVPADARRIAQINVRCWQHAYAGIVPAAALTGMTAGQRLPGWQRRIDRPDPEAVFVAVDAVDADAAGDAVGAYAAVGPSRSAEVPGGELMAIYADPDRLGAGAGHAVHETALVHLAGQGFTEVSLWVLAADALGRRFYDRHHWQLTPDATTVTLAGAELTELRLTRPLR